MFIKLTYGIISIRELHSMFCSSIPLRDFNTHARAHTHARTHARTHRFLECAFMKQTYDFLGQTDLTGLSDTSTQLQAC